MPRRATIFLYGAASALFAVAHPAFCLTPTPQQADMLLRDRARQIRTLDVRLRRSDLIDNTNPLLVDLKLDMTSGNMYAVCTMDVGRDDPRIAVCVRNKDFEWRANAMHDSRQPGAFSVGLHKRAKSVMPPLVDRDDFALDAIDKIIIPFHVILEKQNRVTDIAASPVKVRDINAEDPAHTVLKYGIYDGNDLIGQLTYTLDLTDGLKVCSYTMSDTRSATPKVGIRNSFSDFTKVNGIWMPKSSHEQWFNPDGSLAKDTLVTAESITPNCVFQPDDFQYDPPYGSPVHDHITGVSYIAGYANTEAPLGADFLDPALAQQNVPDSGRDPNHAPDSPADQNVPISNQNQNTTPEEQPPNPTSSRTDSLLAWLMSPQTLATLCAFALAIITVSLLVRKSRSRH